MAEMDLTKKITAIVKGTDKLIQDVMKDAKQIKDSITSLKDSFKKPEDKDHA
jgi:hypothetical protein